MWFFAIAALAFLAYEIASPPAASAITKKTTSANVDANWPTHTVVDTQKIKAMGYDANVQTQYEGVDPKVAQAMLQFDPTVAQAFLGTVPMFITAQLAMGQRVWIGSPIQDESAQLPAAYLPLYVGSTPPSTGGFVEVTS